MTDRPDNDDREYIRHQRTVVGDDDTRETTEERIPRLSDEASPKEILQFLASFRRARGTMHWTTGPRLFQKFRVHWEDDHLDTWDAIAETVQQQSVNTFNEALEDFKAELLQGYHYLDQMSYLRKLKKTSYSYSFPICQEVECCLKDGS